MVLICDSIYLWIIKFTVLFLGPFLCIMSSQLPRFLRNLYTTACESLTFKKLIIPLWCFLKSPSKFHTFTYSRPQACLPFAYYNVYIRHRGGRTGFSAASEWGAVEWCYTIIFLFLFMLVGLRVHPTPLYPPVHTPFREWKSSKGALDLIWGLLYYLRAENSATHNPAWLGSVAQPNSLTFHSNSRSSGGNSYICFVCGLILNDMRCLDYHKMEQL